MRFGQLVRVAFPLRAQGIPVDITELDQFFSDNTLLMSMRDRISQIIAGPEDFPDMRVKLVDQQLFADVDLAGEGAFFPSASASFQEVVQDLLCPEVGF